MSIIGIRATSFRLSFRLGSIFPPLSTVDFPLEPLALYIEWISLEHLLRGPAAVAVDRHVVGLWRRGTPDWVWNIPALPEVVCVLRLGHDGRRSI